MAMRKDCGERLILTIGNLLDSPPALDLDTANRAFGLGRATGYALAKRGRYPVRVLRVGRAYRVPTVDLFVTLGLPDPTEALWGEGAARRARSS